MCFLILKSSNKKNQATDLKAINLKYYVEKHDFKFVEYINENDSNII
jgi:translation initiation factor IF-3